MKAAIDDVENAVVVGHDQDGAVLFSGQLAHQVWLGEVTRWEEFMAQYFPEQAIPTQAKARQKLHRQFDQQLRQDPEFAQLYEQFCSKIDLAKVLLEQGIWR